MSVDPITFSTLAMPGVRDLFRNILKLRTVSRYQLLIEKPDEKDKINNALESLQQAGLIEKAAGGGSEEKDRFYPTGSGLIMEKFVK